jgi:hypothetical protein
MYSSLWSQSSNQGQRSETSYSDPLDAFFADDQEWFDLSASQPFALGNLIFSMDFQPTVSSGELDAAEQSAYDSMVVDEVGEKAASSKEMKEIPSRLHDVPFTSSVSSHTSSSSSAPSIRNVHVDPITKSSPSMKESTLLSFGATNHLDEDSCGPRAKKRPRIDMEDNMPDPSSIKNLKTIAEKLAALDSDSFQEYVDRLESVRKLTSAELNEVKKIRRRIHNRESARKSRQEKREWTDDLDEKIKALTDQLHQTKLEVASLAAENQSLRNEIAFSYHLIANNPVLSQLYADLKRIHEAKRAGTTANQ